ncbi:hydroxysqualene dehydroxylase HpnE [Azospirillum rugosum]|uniref:Squalene-associated FAD-dependent desaturase n=1 Tax=Azospirillum rugosum TaxID=416170 RepID=A0ABS4SDY4_9PROT|nr:hydroxysqualene dehydroxylase HpnE [Azospirillum rugosum]MBP2290784.1 squalene-associated FAD-dependent desaturase [Azospirillum rugosum]MDQ0529651.1 squalene-associated FAD-dependent desaturase [Azospirillum rugosum]
MKTHSAPTVHIVGAGLAGLSAAVRLTAAGRRAVLYESAPQAGGRARSFFDSTLGRTVDNGSHLALSGNRALLAYLEAIGARGGLTELRPAAFPFLDLRNGERWTLRPGGLWLFDKARRVPGSRPADYLSALRTLLAGPSASIADALPPGGPLHDRLWQPLGVSVMNGALDRSSARLFGAVLRETLLRGEAACRPLFAERGLSAALVDPAVSWLERNGSTLRLGSRVDGLERDGDRITALSVSGERVPVGLADSVVLAAPAWISSRLLPGLPAPAAGHAIVNAHFRLDDAPLLPGGLPFLGLVGGTAEWLFLRGDVASVTVSDADSLADQPAEAVAARLWSDVARALALGGPVPPVRIVKEKRATPDQAPAEMAKRPASRIGLENLVLAGDWTETGLPATLEAAIRSGEQAAKALLGARGTTFSRLGLFPAFTLPRRGPI